MMEMGWKRQIEGTSGDEMTIEQVADYLNVSTGYVRNLLFTKVLANTDLDTVHEYDRLAKIREEACLQELANMQLEEERQEDKS